MSALRTAAGLATLILMGCSTDTASILQPEALLAASNANRTHKFSARQLGFPSAPPPSVVCPAGSVPSASVVTGTGTFVGSFTGSAWLCLAFTSATTFQFVSGVNTTVAANGDELESTLVSGSGSFVPTASGTGLVFSSVYNITGGTGRFGGSTGQVTVDGRRDNIADPNSGLQAEIKGTITFR
ncbi:MAG: hypothetical protein IPF98_04565 [Gemmatimonadetes bacterium]|nr:hypothetical protein [Gemmatimonadota bacterium]